MTPRPSFAGLPGHQTLAEEVANAISHGVGAAFSIAALALLVTFASMGGDPWRIVAVSIYGASLVVLFLASTLYHGIQNPRAKHVFWILDHMAIYLLIAGTYTPFTLVTLNGPWGWSIFGVVWGLAALGITYQAFFIGRWPWFSVGLYIAMGWVGLAAIVPLVTQLPLGGFGLVVLGGVFYTAGVVFFRWHTLRYHHLIWHLFVLAGAAAHVWAVAAYVVPQANPTSG
jgi:hemolysin III